MIFCQEIALRNRDDINKKSACVYSAAELALPHKAHNLESENGHKKPTTQAQVQKGQIGQVLQVF